MGGMCRSPTIKTCAVRTASSFCHCPKTEALYGVSTPGMNPNPTELNICIRVPMVSPTI